MTDDGDNGISGRNGDDLGEMPEDPFTIGAVLVQEPQKPPWYRRVWVLAMAAVVVVVVASVLVDLPTHTSVAADTANQTTVMQQINTDLEGCSYAVQESFTIYHDWTQGSLTGPDRTQTPSMLRDDQEACSFTSSSIYDLSNVEGTGTPAGKDVGDVVEVATVWATSDALGAIEDVQVLTAHPGDAAARADLAKRETQLASDRAQADAEVTAADRILDARLPMPDLPDLPRPTGSA